MPAVDREACRPREPTSYGSTDLQHRLVQACQPLSLVSFHGLYRRFKYLHPTSYLALTRLVVARKGRLSRIGPRSSRLALRYIVRAATLFMPLGPPGGTGGLSFINNSLKRLRVAKLPKLWMYLGGIVLRRRSSKRPFTWLSRTARSGRNWSFLSRKERFVISRSVVRVHSPATEKSTRYA